MGGVLSVIRCVGMRTRPWIFDLDFYTNGGTINGKEES